MGREMEGKRRGKGGEVPAPSQIFCPRTAPVSDPTQPME